MAAVTEDGGQGEPVLEIPLCLVRSGVQLRKLLLSLYFILTDLIAAKEGRVPLGRITQHARCPLSDKTVVFTFRCSILSTGFVDTS